MTTANVKFKTGAKESPTEPFKRAVTSVSACDRQAA